MERKGNGYGEWRPCDDTVKPTCFTDEQVEVLENVFADCAKPSGSQRREIIRQNPVLFSLESERIKAWFQNRGFCEKQNKEAIGFQSVNERLSATKKLLLAENVRLQKELLQLANENEYIRQLFQNVSVGTGYETSEPIVTSLRSSKAADNLLGLVHEAAFGGAFPIMVSGNSADWVQIPRIKICGGGEDNSSTYCIKLVITPTNERLTCGDSVIFSSLMKSAIAPLGLRPFPPSPEIAAFANQILQAVRSSSGGELLNAGCTRFDPVLKRILHHEDALYSCSFENLPVSLFADQGGLHMLENKLATLQDMNLDLTVCKSDTEALESVLLALSEQEIVVLWTGICVLVITHCVV